MSQLRLCNACDRHVRAGAGACPFCGEQLGLCTAGSGWAVVLGFGIALSGCGGPAQVGLAGDESSSAPASSTSLEGSSTDYTTYDDGGCDYSGGFYAGWGCEDQLNCGEDCDIWNPSSCPAGQKCTAVICGLGTNAWNSDVCVSIDGDRQLGEVCTAEGNSGEDDCAAGLMCWGLGASMGEGTCVAFCEGSPEDPTCPADTQCVIANDGVLPVCLPSCDPLAPACPNPDDVCVPPFNDEDDWVCIFNSSEGLGMVGAACWGANSCNGGLLCVPAEQVPQCEGERCCSEVCDTLDTNFSCAIEGQTCAPFYEPGAGPPQLANVGVCGVGEP